MFDKIKNYSQRFRWTSANNVRFFGQLLFLIIVLLTSWSGVKTIQSNYVLQQQIATLKQQNQVQQLKNDNLALQNEYYNSDQYLELSARAEFGLGQPGETELLVPQNVALAHISSSAKSSSANTKPNAHQPWYEQNFQAWMDFFLHRPTSSQ